MIAALVFVLAVFCWVMEGRQMYALERKMTERHRP